MRLDNKAKRKHSIKKKKEHAGMHILLVNAINTLSVKVSGSTDFYFIKEKKAKKEKIEKIVRMNVIVLEMGKEKEKKPKQPLNIKFTFKLQSH